MEFSLWIFLSLCMITLVESILLVDLNSAVIDGWSLSSCDQSIKSIKAKVPGNVHTDLLNSILYGNDPYYRFNELNMSWIPLKCWKYELVNFNIPLYDSQYLLFKEIDTVSKIYVNGFFIGSTKNAHRSHLLRLNTSVIRPNNNTLQVIVESPLKYSKKQSESYPYEIPATENYNVGAEPSHRSFIRKAGSDMGWDWGPAFATSGISGDVFLVYAPDGYLDGISVVQQFDNSNFSSAVTLHAVSYTHLTLPTIYSV